MRHAPVAAAVEAEFFADRPWETNFLVNLGYGDASGNYLRGQAVKSAPAAGHS